MTLISLNICLHYLRGPYIVCKLSLTIQVSLLPVRKTSIAHYSSNPNGTSKWFIPLFLSWEQ